MLCPFDAVATAMATFVGQNMGAHKMDRVKQGIRVTLALAVGYGIVAGVIMNFGGHFLGSLFVDAANVSVIDAAARYMGALGLLYWLLAILDVTRYAIQSLGFSALSVISVPSRWSPVSSSPRSASRSSATAPSAGPTRPPGSPPAPTSSRCSCI